MMCKWDEAFTMDEMLEETSRCKDCKLNCENAGKQLSEEDKVKVVRCRDCKKHGAMSCPVMSWTHDWKPDDDWFCAAGVRKER